jgi:hypothetical protein
VVTPIPESPLSCAAGNFRGDALDGGQESDFGSARHSTRTTKVLSRSRFGGKWRGQDTYDIGLRHFDEIHICGSGLGVVLLLKKCWVALVHFHRGVCEH